MSVQRNVIANYIGNGWVALMGMAVLPLYMRYLGIESFGLIGFFVTLQAWLVLLDLGLSPTLNREMARFSTGLHTPQSIRDLLRSMEVIFTIVALTIGLLMIGFSSWIAMNWLNLENLSVESVSQALTIMGLAFALQWMGILYRSALTGLQQHIRLSIINSIVATLRAVGSVLVLAFLSPTIFAFVVFQCLIGLLEAVILTWNVYHFLPKSITSAKFSLISLKAVWRFASGLFVITLLATFLTQFDKLLLAKLLTLQQYGYFSLAMTVGGALSLLINPIHNVAYPRLTEIVAINDKSMLADTYHRFAQLVSVAVLPTGLMICIFSYEIVLLWTQNLVTAVAVSPIVSIWIIGTMINGLMHVPYAAQLAHGWSILMIKANAIAVMVMIPVVLFFVPVNGVMAAAWIWVTINIGYIIIVVPIMHTRILKLEKWRWYIRDIFHPLLAALFGILIFYFINKTVIPKSQFFQFIFLTAGLIVVNMFAFVATSIGREMMLSIYGRYSKKNEYR